MCLAWGYSMLLFKTFASRNFCMNLNCLALGSIEIHWCQMGLKHGHVTVLERNKFDIKTEEGVNLKMKGAVKRKRK